MNYIFLDVDGVLNNMTWAKKMLDEHNISVFNRDLLYEPSLLYLRDLVEETDAKLILSSAWRKIPSARQALEEQLAKYGLSIFSETPNTGKTRGDDIQAWFMRHGGVYQYVAHSYVILDDDSDMLDSQLPYLVQTSFSDGFGESEYRRAKAILTHTDLHPERTASCLFALAINHMLPDHYKYWEEPSYSHTFYHSDDQILCRDRDKINALADFFDDLGGTAVTGYYDPEEDERNGDTDSFTGFYYLELD